MVGVSKPVHCPLVTDRKKMVKKIERQTKKTRTYASNLKDQILVNHSINTYDSSTKCKLTLFSHRLTFFHSPCASLRLQN